MSSILSSTQISMLRDALEGRLIAACFGSGVDSTAMLIALHEANIKPDIISFADTGGEKPNTLIHLEKMNEVLAAWGWPLIDVCVKQTLDSTSYNDLYGNCVDNQTLPSLAFGMKSCSIKWKQQPQDNFIKGVARGPNKRDAHPIWQKSLALDSKIVKLIGYDCGKADLRRSNKPMPENSEFDYLYPLQIIGWKREDCVDAISKALGENMVPIKSACFFCPASKLWELYWLAAEHPTLFEKALHMEYVALTGRHSRFDEVEFGGKWEELIKTADRFPSAKTCVGLGRNFAWSQWARVNNVVDEHFKVRNTPEDVIRFKAMADMLRKNDNALDQRSNVKKIDVIKIIETVNN